MNRSIERLKHQMEFRMQTASARETGYRELWALTEIVSSTIKTDFTMEQRQLALSRLEE
jgi:hypothetical protein